MQDWLISTYLCNKYTTANVIILYYVGNCANNCYYGPATFKKI